MSLNFGSTSRRETSGGTQTIALPPASPEETELRQLNLQLGKEQLASLQRTQAEQTAYATSPLGMMQKQLEEKATANLLARITGQAPVLSPEEQARLDTIYGTAQSRGEADLMRFGQDIAAQRGMTVADSPIGAELLRQRRMFGEGLAAQRAESALNLGQAEAGFNQSLAQFQSNLRQQALANRLAMAGMSPASFQLGSQLFQQRLAGAPRTSNMFGNVRGSEAGGGISGKDVAGYGSLFGGGGLWGAGGIWGAPG